MMSRADDVEGYVVLDSVKNRKHDSCEKAALQRSNAKFKGTQIQENKTHRVVDVTGEKRNVCIEGGSK